jgi:hypothetical protein
MSEFLPPIKDRSTDELLNIVGNPDGWNKKAVNLAKNELIQRNIPTKKVETASYLIQKRKRLEVKAIANEGYHICDFILTPFPTLFELIFAWELKKDGRFKKARQQKYFRLTLLVLLIGRVTYLYIKNQILV